MANTKKSLNDKIRSRYMEMVINYLKENSETVLLTNSNEIALPCVDDEGNDAYIVMTFKVPTGSRDGTPYDGYMEAEGYSDKLAEKAVKEKEKADKKAKKIEADKKAREAKAKAKAEAKAEAKGD